MCKNDFFIIKIIMKIKRIKIIIKIKRILIIIKIKRIKIIIKIELTLKLLQALFFRL